jgi:hypothetical protein
MCMCVMFDRVYNEKSGVLMIYISIQMNAVHHILGTSLFSGWLQDAVRGSDERAFNDLINMIPVGEGKGLLLVHRASSFGWLETLEFLLSQGYDVNERDHADRTPLHVAVALHNTEKVRLLLQYGADTLLRDNEGETALVMLCSYTSMYEASRMWTAEPYLGRRSGGIEEYWQRECESASLLTHANVKIDLLTPNKHGWFPHETIKSNQNVLLRGQIMGQLAAIQAERNVAMMMALHDRLGRGSSLGNLGSDVLALVAKQKGSI